MRQDAPCAPTGDPDAGAPAIAETGCCARRLAWSSDGSQLGYVIGTGEDRTYGYLLWIDERGVVHAQAGCESGEREPVSGLPEALAADW